MDYKDLRFSMQEYQNPRFCPNKSFDVRKEHSHSKMSSMYNKKNIFEDNNVEDKYYGRDHLKQTKRIGNKFMPRTIFRTVNHKKQKEGPYLLSVVGNKKTTQPLIDSHLVSWNWILYFLLLCVNGAIVVIMALDVIGIGPGLPLLDIVAHFSLFVGFGVLFIYAVIQLGKETMLEDKMGLPLVTFVATLYNFVMTFVFLSWVLDNTSQHAEVKYVENMQAYSSFIGISAWSCAFFFIIVVSTLVVIYIRYVVRKIQEINGKMLIVQNKHLENLHETSLPKLISEMEKNKTFVA